MAVVEQTSGSQTCTVGTEHTLATRTDGKTYVLYLDLANLANGDTLEVRLYEKVRTGDTSRVVVLDSMSHVQAEPIYVSVPLGSAWEWKATIKQTAAATGRAIPWSVRSLD